MRDILAVREGLKPNEHSPVSSPDPGYSVYRQLYNLALTCTSTDEFLAKAEALHFELPDTYYQDEKRRQDSEYCRNLALVRIGNERSIGVHRLQPDSSKHQQRYE